MTKTTSRHLLDILAEVPDLATTEANDTHSLPSSDLL